MFILWHSNLWFTGASLLFIVSCCLFQYHAKWELLWHKLFVFQVGCKTSTHTHRHKCKLMRISVHVIYYKTNLNKTRSTHPSNEHCLHIFDNLQSDRQTDRNQIVVQNNECQQVVAKICRFKLCKKMKQYFQMHNHKALLFVIVMEALYREFRVTLPWELLYADDMAVIAETEDDLIKRLHEWKSILCIRVGYTALHKLLGGTGVTGHTARFFAVYVHKIWIRCIFIKRHYARAVYAIVVCPSVWCVCSILAAKWLDSSIVGIAPLAYAADESTFCR